MNGPAQTGHEVDWLTGGRDYIRLADALAVAPIPRDARQLDLFFHAHTNCRARWMPFDQTRNLPARNVIVANLKIAGPNHVHKFCFVVDNASPITRHVPDLVEPRIASTITISDQCSFLTMSDEFNLWEHIAGSAKSLGAVLFPGVHWYMVYLKADLMRIPRAPAGKTMTMRVKRRRLGVLELTYWIDGAAVGTVGARERAD